MTAKEFSAAARKVGAEYRTMKMSERIAAMKPREMTATEVAASRYADEIRCRMAGIPVAPPLPSGLYDEGFVRMHGNGNVDTGLEMCDKATVAIATPWHLEATHTLTP